MPNVETNRIPTIDDASEVIRTVRWRLRMWYFWPVTRSEEHTSELQSHSDLVCRLLLEKKKNKKKKNKNTTRVTFIRTIAVNKMLATHRYNLV